MAAHHKPKSKERLSVNLLYPQGVPQKLPVKFLKWLLSYGRFLAIVVELVVISAFIARFKLDSDLSDLKDKNNNQINYIKSLSNDEIAIRQTQFELSTIDKTYLQNPDWNTIFSELTKQLPTGVTLSSINFDHTENSKSTTFRITGTSTTNTDLATFIGGLKQDSLFQNIYLANIALDSGQITFTVTGGTSAQ